MPDDNIPSQKYHDTGILLYFVTSSIVDNFCKNPTVRIVCSALADSFSHVCVLMWTFCLWTWLSCCWHLCWVLMYADDLLLISSTCSDLRRMLRTIFSKPTVYNTITFNTAVFFWYRYTAHPYLLISSWTGNDLWPKCGDALWLGSKSMMAHSIRGMCGWQLIVHWCFINTCHTWMI